MLKRFFVIFILFVLPFAGFSQVNKPQTGTASYYGKKFNGRRTSSGEKHCKDSLMAAHKTLPLGTYVKITRLSNGKTVVVKINDRLPPKSKRLVDLSYRAAKELNMISDGVAKVTLEVLPKKE